MAYLLGPHFVAARIVSHLGDGGRPMILPGFVARVPVRFRQADGGYSPTIWCLLDTGATHSLIGRPLAIDLGFDLTGEPEFRVNGVTGSSAAWLLPRYTRYRDLPGFEFKTWFLIPDGDDPPAPVLGLRDIYLNFEMATSDGRVHFLLKDTHRGDPYPLPPGWH